MPDRQPEPWESGGAGPFLLDRRLPSESTESYCRGISADAEQINAIEERFAAKFANWGIRLPPGSAAQRHGGHIFEQDWHIGYVWGEENGDEYLEVLSQHRMTDDSRVRLWASGRDEPLSAPGGLVLLPPGGTDADRQSALAESAERNRALYEELRDRGLLPPEGGNLAAMEINEFLASGGMADEDSERSDDPAEAADSAVPRWLGAAATTLEQSEELPLELREHDLSSALKQAIDAERPGCAKTKVLRLNAWPSLGRSGTDIVVLHEEGSGTPVMGFELKWCRQGHDKIHEAIWDLFKVGLLVDEYQVEGYLVTAALPVMWTKALCNELFSSGTRSSRELFGLEFPNGRPVWDWLLEGGYDRSPIEVPDATALIEAGRVPVSFGTLEWEIRAVRVLPSSGRPSLKDGWPDGERPSRATHPVNAEG
jgi:hypothetical protein